MADPATQTQLQPIEEYWFTTKRNISLERYFAEEWKNQRDEVGYQNPDDIYHLARRITQDMPITFNELIPQKIKTAKKKRLKLTEISNSKIDCCIESYLYKFKSSFSYVIYNLIFATSCCKPSSNLPIKKQKYNNIFNINVKIAKMKELLSIRF